MIEWTGLHGERFLFSIEEYSSPEILDGYNANRVRCRVEIENSDGPHEYLAGAIIMWEIEWFSRWLAWVVKGEAKSDRFDTLEGELRFYYLERNQDMHHFSLVLHYVGDEVISNVVNLVVSDAEIEKTLVYLKQKELEFPLRGFEGEQVVDYLGPKKRGEEMKYVEPILEKPRGPYHDFWLFEIEERDFSSFKGYGDLVGRKDAPLRVPDDLMYYFDDWFRWMYPHNPANKSEPVLTGFNTYGPTVFKQEHGALLRVICKQFRDLYMAGPEEIILTGSWMHEIDADGDESEGHYAKLKVEREWLVGMFSVLAEFAVKVERGTHVLLHLGV